jgi:hypothetical protein
MSDFLTNLAARSLGLIETVRPRVVSMFEPLRAAVGPTSGPGLGSQMIDETLPDGAGDGVKPEIYAVAGGMGDSRGHLARQLVPGIRSGDTDARPGVGLESQESDLSVAPFIPASQGQTQAEPSRIAAISRLQTGAFDPAHGIVQPAPPQAPARWERLHSARADVTSMSGSRLVAAGDHASKPSREPANDPRASSPRLENEMRMISRPLALSSDARRVHPSIELGASPSPPDVNEPAAVPHAAPPPLVAGGVLGPSTESKILAAESQVREDPAIRPRFSATLFGKESDAVPDSSASPSVARHAHLSTWRNQPASPRFDVLGRAVRSRTKASSPVVPQHTAESEPTIQVTIGRIEVRAEPAAPEPSKKRLGQPAMSLDEYLRQCANRGRQ